ncbi:MAG: NAD(P)H-dependent oxidoreductase [Armatimonadetes bacterium]|nr:NAD(P)H-dependent oxidoreductase [Armatimonadota bacterium]
MPSSEVKSSKILVIMGHPTTGSLCDALATEYAEGARSAGAQVEFVRLSELDAAWLEDPRTVSEVEPAITEIQASIKNADTLVIAYPVWWGSSPAILKAFCDRVLLTGYAYRYKSNGFPEGLLKGRSARIMVTMDSPAWWHRWVYRRSSTTWLQWATLWFCGFKVRKPVQFCEVRKSSDSLRNQWLGQARQLGRMDATR